MYLYTHREWPTCTENLKQQNNIQKIEQYRKIYEEIIYQSLKQHPFLRKIPKRIENINRPVFAQTVKGKNLG